MGMVLAWPMIASALSADEILVVANLRVGESLSLARFYMEKRGIPKSRLVTVSTPFRESCTRSVYEETIASPVRRYLKGDRDAPHRVRCLLLMWGIPLRIDSFSELIENGLSYMSGSQGKTAATIEKDGQGQGGRKEDPPLEPGGIHSRQASVDSEIALVLKEGYALEGWVQNPYFLGWHGVALPVSKEEVLMVSRLDGPSPDIVRRVILDSMETETRGLSGNACFDARWPDSQASPEDGYRRFDAMIHRTVDRVRNGGRLPVRIDDSPALFQHGDCPNAALYCGWYSLGNYVDAFTWQAGAVGYHVASGECVTLKKKESRAWCKMMLEKGIAATIGPVGEPYVQAFPAPQIFFGFLLDGYLTLAEVYLISSPYISWKMVLIGDPLYRPFKPRFEWGGDDQTGQTSLGN